MGWLISPEKGSGLGPCEQPCKHRDCAAARRDFEEKPCKHCDKPIGYGVRFYYLPDDEIAHADCEELASSKEAGT